MFGHKPGLENEAIISGVLTKSQKEKRLIQLKALSTKHMSSVEDLIVKNRDKLNKQRLSVEDIAKISEKFVEDMKKFERPSEVELRKNVGYQDFKCELKDDNYLVIINGAIGIAYKAKQLALKEEMKNSILTHAYCPELIGGKYDRNGNAAFILSGIDKAKDFRIYNTLDLILNRAAEEIYEQDIGGAFVEIVWILAHYDLNVNKKGYIIASPIKSNLVTEKEIKEDQDDVLPKLSQKRYTIQQAKEWMGILLYFWNEKFSAEDRFKAIKAWAIEIKNSEKLVLEKNVLNLKVDSKDFLTYKAAVTIADEILAKADFTNTEDNLSQSATVSMGVRTA